MRFDNFAIVIEKEPEEYGPSLPGCFSNGRTIEEARRNTREAIRAACRVAARASRAGAAVPLRFVGKQGSSRRAAPHCSGSRRGSFRRSRPLPALRAPLSPRQQRHGFPRVAWTRRTKKLTAIG
jgi:hypothetical protein